MIERFPEPARQVFELADEESDRMQHNYVGCEHVLAGLARHPTSPVADILAAQGFDVDAIRAELARLVDQGVLPPPWRNHAALLRGLGVDLSAVRQHMEESFGPDAVDRATRRALRTTGWSPLCGKAHVFKQALHLAHQRRHALGHAHTGPGHILLGVLDDAEHPLDRPRCFNNPWNRRRRANLGLPDRGPSPVRLIVQARGTTLAALREAAVSHLNATSWTR
jgi:ATP-dependent Clp protease ATP-binding subunit ClpA